MANEMQKNDLKNIDLSSIKSTCSKVHPHSDLIFQITQQKVTEELGPEFKLSRDMCDFSFYSYRLMNSEILSCVLIFNMCAVLLDDHLERFPENYKNWIQYLESKKIPGNEYLARWFQFFIKIAEKILGRTALDQLMEQLIFCISKIPEVERICSGESTLTDKEFVDLRIIDSGALHQFYLILISADVKLTDELKNDPDYVGLNKQAAIHASLINDLYSLKKEVIEERYHLNYVYVKMNNGKLTAQAAINEVIHEVMEAERMAHVYGESLKQRNDLNLIRYVDTIFTTMTGNNYWSSICRRYNQF